MLTIVPMRAWCCVILICLHNTSVHYHYYFKFKLNLNDNDNALIFQSVSRPYDVVNLDGFI